MAKNKKLTKQEEQWAMKVAKKTAMDINNLIQGIIIKEQRKKKLRKLLGKDNEEKQ